LLKGGKRETTKREKINTKGKQQLGEGNLKKKRLGQGRVIRKNRGWIQGQDSGGPQPEKKKEKTDA